MSLLVERFPKVENEFLKLLLCIVLRTTYASLNAKSIVLVSALGFFVCRLLTQRDADIFRELLLHFIFWVQL